MKINFCSIILITSITSTCSQYTYGMNHLQTQKENGQDTEQILDHQSDILLLSMNEKNEAARVLNKNAKDNLKHVQRQSRQIQALRWHNYILGSLTVIFMFATWRNWIISTDPIWCRRLAGIPEDDDDDDDEQDSTSSPEQQEDTTNPSPNMSAHEAALQSDHQVE